MKSINNAVEVNVQLQIKRQIQYKIVLQKHSMKIVPTILIIINAATEPPHAAVNVKLIKIASIPSLQITILSAVTEYVGKLNVIIMKIV